MRENSLTESATWVIASANPGKMAEFETALQAVLPGLRFLSAEAAGVRAFPPEDGQTYEENALVKAKFAAEATGLPSLGDDSGLEVAALDGAPGLYSARYGGELSNDERLAYLLEQLNSVSPGARGARFVCSLVLAFPGGAAHSFWGECQGEILAQPQGEGGFGYDPIFYNYDLKQSFAQAASTDKANVSHRGRALAALTRWLAQRVTNTDTD